MFLFCIFIEPNSGVIAGGHLEAFASWLFLFQAQHLNTSAMNQKEIWKDIEGYTGLYQVSSHGRIKSLNRYVNGAYNNKEQFKSGRLLKISANPSGYMICILSKDGKLITKTVHRIAGKAFIPNPENKEQINHKNGIKIDNRIENLEWATRSENQLHYYRVLGGRPGSGSWAGKSGKEHPRSKTVLQFTLNNNLIGEFGSTHEAKRRTGINQVSITRACNNKQKKAGRFIWKYLDN